MIDRLALGIAVLVFGGSLPAAALTVFADFDGDMVHDPVTTVAPGTMFTGSIYASVDDEHGGLTSYGVEMTFGEPPIRATSVVSDPQFGLPETITLNPGVVEALDADLFMGFIGTAVHLFDVTFSSLAPGVTSLQMGNIYPAAPLFDGFVGFDGFVYDPIVMFETTRVVVTPEPTALSLLAAGMLALAAARRRPGRR